MTRPRVLTIWLDTWYGTGKGESSDNMIFGHGLFDQLGFDEVHVPLESDARPQASEPFEFIFIVPYQKVEPSLRTYGCPVVAWMCDDVWRYESFGKPWLEVADFIVTTDPASAALYGDKGILSNWAVRPEWEIHGRAVPQGLSASFQGQMYGTRRDRLAVLEQALSVTLLANDTGEEYLSPQRYFEGIAGSAFTICLTESSHRKRQMKSRLFEPQLFNSILVTEKVPELEKYWEPGVECITFDTPEEAARRVQQLASNWPERMAMARRARERLLAEHTYQHRFTAILDRLGVTVG